MTQDLSAGTPQVVVQCRACDGTGEIDGQKCETCDGSGFVPYLEPRSIFSMTPEQRKEIMDKNPPEITSVHYGNAYFDWTWRGCGYGQLSFSVDPKTGEISCMDEHMGRESARTLLIALANHIADHAKFDE